MAKREVHWKEDGREKNDILRIKRCSYPQKINEDNSINN
jgi:hypothetical protein